MRLRSKAGFRLGFVFSVCFGALAFWLMKPAPALAGGAVVNCVARWNGTTWSPLAQGILFGGTVYALTQLPNGDIFAGG